jgi:hypothetical protein
MTTIFYQILVFLSIAASNYFCFADIILYCFSLHILRSYKFSNNGTFQSNTDSILDSFIVLSLLTDLFLNGLLQMCQSATKYSLEENKDM